MNVLTGDSIRDKTCSTIRLFTDTNIRADAISRMFRAANAIIARYLSRPLAQAGVDESARRCETPSIYYRYCSALYNGPYSYVTSTNVETPRGKIAVVTKECVRGERTIENRLLLSARCEMNISRYARVRTRAYVHACTHVHAYTEVGQAHQVVLRPGPDDELRNAAEFAVILLRRVRFSKIVRANLRKNFALSIAPARSSLSNKELLLPWRVTYRCVYFVHVRVVYAVIVIIYVAHVIRVGRVIYVILRAVIYPTLHPPRQVNIYDARAVHYFIASGNSPGLTRIMTQSVRHKSRRFDLIFFFSRFTAK